MGTEWEVREDRQGEQISLSGSLLVKERREVGAGIRVRSLFNKRGRYQGMFQS